MLLRETNVRNLQAVAHAGAGLAVLLGGVLGALLHGRHVLLAAVPVRLDGLLAVRRQLRLPVALARLVLR